MNPQYLVEQLELIDEYIGHARSISRRTNEEFLADQILIDAAIRELNVIAFEPRSGAGFVAQGGAKRNPGSEHLKAKPRTGRRKTRL